MSPFIRPVVVNSVPANVTACPYVFVWLVATRRYRAAVASAAMTAVLVGGSWALIGFAGLGDYPELLRVLAQSLERDSYTIFALASDLGAPDLLARGVGIAVGTATLLGCWVLGRRGDEPRSFTLAILTALLLTPIVWLHYFALLLVPIAIAHKRLSLLWAIPVLLWLFVQGSGNGTSFQTAWALGVGALIAWLLLRVTPTKADADRLPAPRARIVASREAERESVEPPLRTAA